MFNWAGKRKTCTSCLEGDKCIVELQSQLKERDNTILEAKKVLSFYGNAVRYITHFRDKYTLTVRDVNTSEVQHDYGKQARDFLDKLD